mmetsp:Transcript_75450/g.157337  ORF Transcript_75450/g.157337 Transcript_75450/m.157337 type:complete len:120 (-) Transcript_75450:914-1273(-)
MEQLTWMSDQRPEPLKGSTTYRMEITGRFPNKLAALLTSTTYLSICSSWIRIALKLLTLRGPPGRGMWTFSGTNKGSISTPTVAFHWSSILGRGDGTAVQVDCFGAFEVAFVVPHSSLP